MKKILEHLHILTADGVIRGSIAVEGKRMVHIGEIPDSFLEGSQPERTDYRFRVLAMPGLFNAHTHLSMVLFRNYADGLPLMEWLSTKIWPAEAKLTSDDIYYSSLLGMAELIRSGCTSFRDMYDHMDRVCEATVKSGLRGFIGQGMIMTGESDLKKLDKTDMLIDTFGHHDRICIEVAPHAPYTCTDDALVASKRKAQDRGTVLHIHLSESEDEVAGSLREFGVTPTARLKNLGILGNHVAAAHCAKMTDEDLDILAETGTSVLLNPSSNLKLGNGIARAKDMLARNICCALGTDGASSNNNLNMLEELHLAALLYGITAREAVEIATLGGAKSAGRDDLGLLKEGFLADIAFLDLSSASLTPHGDLMSAVCYSASAADVVDLMVDGKFVMKDRTVLTFDEEAVKMRCREITARLLGEENDFA